MTTTWQSYKTQLAALFGQQAIPVPIRHPGRRVEFAPGEPTDSEQGGHDAAAQVVRLPGIRRPESGQFRVRIY